ncbi:MAG: hypothetical protein HC836_40725 [Richelia sp. RM2_1_2]|nr:hypothetical protein [Richelia sp. RM2_1_2]
MLLKKRLELQTQYIKRLNDKNKFYIKLEQSILKYGFDNPILIQAGFCTDIYKKYLPEDHQRDLTKSLCCDRHGGSRLYVAQKHNLDIPCIISDFVGRFVSSGYQEFNTQAELMTLFKVRPKRIIINEHGVHVCEPVHTHLEKESTNTCLANARR